MQKIATPRICNQFRSIWVNLSLRTQSSRLSSSSSNDGNDESEPKSKKKQSKDREPPKTIIDKSAASAKLADLLQTIIKEDLAIKAEPLKLSIAKTKKGAFKKIKSAAAYQLGQEMADAISEVTKSYGGDKDTMQAELVDKVASMKKPTVEHVLEEDVPKEDPNVNSEPINLSELLVGMEVDRTQPKRDFEPNTRSSQVRALMDGKMRGFDKSRGFDRSRGYDKSRGYDDPQGFDGQNRRRPMQRNFPREGSTVRVNFKDSVPLGIFKDMTSVPPTEPFLPVWEKMQKRELRLAITHPPDNIYEEMILWTNQGKLWKFPINNEQGMEAEENVPFSEHIFLEKHLQGWCPTKGPVRHFMELVCNGLSKNPHFTVEEKKTHIQEYRAYFESKKDVLEELGAM